jgi:hypothetical protein
MLPPGGAALVEEARVLRTKADELRLELAASTTILRRRAIERQIVAIEQRLYLGVRPWRRCPTCLDPIKGKVTKQFCSRQCKERANKGELHDVGRVEANAINLDHLAHVAWKTWGWPKTSSGSDGVYRFKDENGNVMGEMTPSQAREFLAVAAKPEKRKLASGLPPKKVERG